MTSICRVLPMGILLLVPVVLGGCSVGNFELADGNTHSSGIDMSVGNVEIGTECVIKGGISLTAGNVEVEGRTVVKGPIEVTHGNVELDDEVSAVF